MPYDNLQVDVADRIATVTIDRPKALNALDRATLLALDAAFADLGRDPAVGAVLLTGAGDKAFVAGADIVEMSQMGAGAAEEFARFGQGILGRIETLGKPVVAAVNGFALGGGCELAMAATLRIASDNAEFGQPEVNLGIMPGFAGTQRLARLVGPARALELILTGDRITAAEALAWGLVSRVVARDRLVEEGRALLAKILTRAPRAVAYSVEAVRRGLEAGFAEGSRLEAALFGLCFATADMREGTRAFVEKRRPTFTGA